MVKNVSPWHTLPYLIRNSEELFIKNYNLKGRYHVELSGLLGEKAVPRITKTGSVRTKLLSSLEGD